MEGKVANVRVTWAGEHRFDAGRPNGPAHQFDSSGVTGQSPLDALLSGLAGCISTDVVAILEKRKTPLRSLTIDVTGERVATVPQRFKHITLHFTAAGVGLDRVHVERAIELSATKYCSVRDSLREDIVVDWTVTLEP
jgi:putative redox protein